ncbi:MAG: cyclic nucleotide-binding domain-containing protein [Dehalococcoidia bacterium]|jgi:CRP/FNR family transcriptional regulator, cyclic AMP receptor protein
MFRSGRSDKVDILRGIPLFGRLSQSQLSAIAKCADVVARREGAVLAKQGAQGLEAIIIVEGRARVEADGRALAELGPGDIVGEMSVIDGKPRSATVIASTPMTLLILHRRDFVSLLETVPGLQRKLLVTLCERVRQADQALTH